MRKPVIAGNWKMYKTVEEGLALIEGLAPQVSANTKVEIIVCPAAPVLGAIAGAVSGSNIGLGAQNLYPKEEGPYTGESSGAMLKSVGCRYCIVGHSERREYFKENDAFVNEKARAVLAAGLVPIVCVGESLEEREGDRTFEVIGRQIDGALAGITADAVAGIILAYEPIWAIGTGKTATPEIAQEVHAFIRRRLAERYDAPTAEAVRIQYGGSVKPANIDILMSQPDIDGALVGGASLTADSFARLINFESP